MVHQHSNDMGLLLFWTEFIGDQRVLCKLSMGLWLNRLELGITYTIQIKIVFTHLPLNPQNTRCLSGWHMASNQWVLVGWIKQETGPLPWVFPTVMFCIISLWTLGGGPTILKPHTSSYYLWTCPFSSGNVLIL